MADEVRQNIQFVVTKEIACQQTGEPLSQAAANFSVPESPSLAVDTDKVDDKQLDPEPPPGSYNKIFIFMQTVKHATL